MKLLKSQKNVVHSFVIAGRGPAYSGPQRWDLSPMCQPLERSRICRCVCDECAACRVKKDSSRSEQLVVYFYSEPPLGVAYCLAKPKLAQLTRISNMQTDTQTDWQTDGHAMRAYAAPAQHHTLIIIKNHLCSAVRPEDKVALVAIHTN